MTTKTKRPGHCPKCDELLTGRHCLKCGWSRAQTLEEPKAHRAPRASTAYGLMATLEAYGLVLPRNAIEWRDGGRVKGRIPSLRLEPLQLLATDGVVAYFLLPDYETVFFGHLGNFEAYEPEVLEEIKTGKPRSVAKAKLKLLAEQD